VFDGRNIYDPKRLQEAGFSYYGIGRGTRLTSSQAS
jgi:UDPglucose 6-dehydrogenase